MNRDIVKLIQLAELVGAKTSAGEIAWHQAPFAPSEFVASLGGNGLRVRVDDDGGYELWVERGSTPVDRLSSDDLTERGLDGYEITSARSTLRNLYEAARRKALNADDVIGELFAILQRPAEK